MGQLVQAKIVLSINSSWNIVNFRSGLIRSLVAAGHEVVVVSPQDAYSEKIPALGCRYIPMPIDSGGVHPGRDLLLVVQYLRILFKEKPSVYLGYTVKPNIYGSLACHLLRIPVISNIAGLGFVFMAGGWLRPLVRFMYRAALMPARLVFFQNEEDREYFVSWLITRRQRTLVLPGSGVDLDRFAYSAPIRDSSHSGVKFLLVARMLWDKGVGEFVEAARVLQQEFPDCEWALLGAVKGSNPACIAPEIVDQWVAEGVVTYLGVTDDVCSYIRDADCVVLPSYREGRPRVLLEAMAVGRPIVAANSVGCREVVREGENGFLCEPKDVDSLVEAMRKVIKMSFEQRVEMGRRGRAIAEREFDEKIVINAYLEQVAKVCGCDGQRVAG